MPEVKVDTSTARVSYAGRQHNVGGCRRLCSPSQPPLYVMQQVGSCGLDGRTVKAMRTLANRNNHASRAVLNAACGGLLMGDRRERVFEQNSQCPYCAEAEGSASHTLYDCPALEVQRKQEAVPAPRDDIPKCVRVLGLGTLFPSSSPLSGGGTLWKAY
eukprot:2549120-Amphidinium_carterae.1